jgi:hypothetical protein
MPTGLFKTPDQSVQVDYDGVSIPLPRSTYENNGYKPDFDNLPLEAEYRAAKEKLANAQGSARGCGAPFYLQGLHGRIGGLRLLSNFGSGSVCWWQDNWLDPDRLRRIFAG